MNNESGFTKGIKTPRQALEKELSRCCGIKCSFSVQVYQPVAGSQGNTGIFHCYSRRGIRSGYGFFVAGEGDDSVNTEPASAFHYCLVSCSGNA